MAPAGGWPQLRAAVANGADSVYVGLTSFSARARAANFHPRDDLPQAVHYCHEHGVQLYVALNTLVFDMELQEIVQLVYDMIDAQVDAVIVQDVGVVRLIQRILQQQQQSSLSVHASTQQTVTSADGVAFCRDMGASRVVLGRELSVRDIGQVWSELEHDETNLATTPGSTVDTASAPVELEVFVHGALCVSYSGQCFSSEAWGGRSANRGQCAQACRLPYGLVVDGTLRDFQPDLAYLLSPQDLCGLDQVPALIQSGVRCLKIEGRLKDELYVAATTRAYRQAVDQAWQQLQEQQQHHQQEQQSSLPPANGAKGQQRQPLDLEERQQLVTRTDLAQVFSRGQDEEHDGLTPGFLDGTQHQRLVRGRSPRHRGVHIGRVLPGSSWRSGLFVTLSGQVQHLQRGDGIVVDRGMAQEEELGGTIFDIQIINNGSNNDRVNNTVLWVKFGREVEKKWKQMDATAISSSRHRSDGTRHGDSSTGESAAAPVGAHVWKTSDPSVERKLRQWSEAPPPKLPVKVRVTGTVGEPLSIYIHDAQHRVSFGNTEEALQVASSTNSNTNFTAQVVKAIGTFGNTRWTVTDIDTSELSQDVWCPISWIKDARRQAVESLDEQYTGSESKSAETQNSSNRLVSKNFANELMQEMKSRLPGNNDNPKGLRLSVLARDYDQVDALCRLIEDDGYKIDEIMIDFLEVDGMRHAVSRIRQVESEPAVRVVIASPRILKPGEEGIWRTLLRLRPDALLVRSAGLLYRLNQLGGKGSLVNVGVNGDDVPDEWVPIPSLLGDFSLNVANALTAFEFLTNHGLERVTASYDLSANAITSLARQLGGTLEGQAARHLEAVIHAKLPIFHTEHCVFARFLSKGNSYLDCGHVCTRHHVHLRDVNSGADNLVLADMGCRNTVFAAQAQSGVHSMKEWRDAGIGHVRIELVDEPADDVRLIVGGYLDVLEGRASASRVWESLQQIRDRNGRRSGVSHGSLRNHVERRAGEL
jgi:collagenase-like PrtC family protease